MVLNAAQRHDAVARFCGGSLARFEERNRNCVVLQNVEGNPGPCPKWMNTARIQATKNQINRSFALLASINTDTADGSPSKCRYRLHVVALSQTGGLYRLLVSVTGLS